MGKDGPRFDRKPVDGNMAGSKGHEFRQGRFDACCRLRWKSIDEVTGQACKSRFFAELDDVPCLIRCMGAAHQAQFTVLKGLDAQAQAVHPQRAQPPQVGLIDGSWIGFKGHFPRCIEIAFFLEGTEDGGEFFQ